MKLIYTGPDAGGLDIPSAGIVDWKQGEEREVSDKLAEELLARGDFKKPDVKWNGLVVSE